MFSFNMAVDGLSLCRANLQFVLPILCARGFPEHKSIFGDNFRHHANDDASRVIETATLHADAGVENPFFKR
jgi:hypothetical protein